MVATLKTIWLPRLAAFLLALLATANVAYWVLQWMRPHELPSSPSMTGAGSTSVDIQAVTRALGGGSSAESRVAHVSLPASGRFTLTGVIAGQSQKGAALISVDGKPAKPFSVGAIVDGDWMLSSVNHRRAVLTIGGSGTSQIDASVVLDMPVLGKPGLK